MTPRKNYVCQCLKVTEADVVEAIRRHEINGVCDITRYTQAGDGCTACHPLLEALCQRVKSTCSPNRSAPKDSSQSQPALSR